jgi:hypothetical protein
MVGEGGQGPTSTDGLTSFFNLNSMSDWMVRIHLSYVGLAGTEGMRVPLQQCLEFKLLLGCDSGF